MPATASPPPAVAAPANFVAVAAGVITTAPCSALAPRATVRGVPDAPTTLGLAAAAHTGKARALAPAWWR
jgi:hypothetical protein